jgi:hypothetical protein
MKKSILMSIKPYYGFLIIATMKGWDLAKYGLRKKTVEARKGVPTSSDWDNKAAFYFSKDKKSLARIPEEYRGEVAKLCGTVVCKFVCNKIERLEQTLIEGGLYYTISFDFLEHAMLDDWELHDYGKGSPIYGLHISDLKLYDKPRELSDFATLKKCNSCKVSGYETSACRYDEKCIVPSIITRPPQSWCYVEEL